MNDYVKTMVYLFGLFTPIGLSFILYITWFAAFLSPGKQVTITVNECGEALPEFILLPIALVCCCVSLYMTLKRVLKKR